MVVLYETRLVAFKAEWTIERNDRRTDGLAEGKMSGHSTSKKGHSHTRTHVH